MPDPLADQNILRHRPRRDVDDGDAIGRPQRHEHGRAVAGQRQADGLDQIAADALHLETDRALDRARGDVDHRDRAADLRRHPQLGAVGREQGEARPLVDENVGHDLERRGIDQMRHVGRFRGRDREPVVGRNGHTLRLHADIDLAHDLPALDVDDRRDGVVLVGDVEPAAVPRQRELLGIDARRQIVEMLVGRRVVDLHGVAVGCADEEVLVVTAEGDAARPAADLEAALQFERAAVDDRDGIVLFAGDIDLVRGRRCRERQRRRQHGQQRRRSDPPGARSVFAPPGDRSPYDHATAPRNSIIWSRSATERDRETLVAGRRA